MNGYGLHRPVKSFFSYSGQPVSGLYDKDELVYRVKNQSAEGAGGLGIIRSNKVGKTE